MPAPLKDAQLKRGPGSLATVRWLYRFMQRTLGAVRLSATGFSLSASGRGGLRIERLPTHVAEPVALWQVSAPDAAPNAFATAAYVARQIQATIDGSSISCGDGLAPAHSGINGLALSQRRGKPSALHVTTDGGQVAIYYGLVSGATNDAEPWLPTVPVGIMVPGSYTPLPSASGQMRYVILSIQYRATADDDEPLGYRYEIDQAPAISVVSAVQSTSELGARSVSGTYQHLIAVVSPGGRVQNAQTGLEVFYEVSNPEIAHE